MPAIIVNNARLSVTISYRRIWEFCGPLSSYFY